MAKEIFYHGTSLAGIDGDKIHQKNYNKGVGGNELALGNGFYTTPHLEAAKLLSHLAEVQRQLNADLNVLEQKEGVGNAGIGKIYTIEFPLASILTLETPIDRKAWMEILCEAGISKKEIESLTQADFTNVEIITNQIDFDTNIKGNPYEYVTKFLGFDGLRTCECQWEDWDYFPKSIVDARKFKRHPETVVIYNTDKIESIKEQSLQDILNKSTHKRNALPLRKPGRKL